MRGACESGWYYLYYNIRYFSAYSSKQPLLSDKLKDSTNRFGGRYLSRRYLELW